MRKLFALVILLISLQVGAQTIDRVEPPNWWTGFRETGLQLMVYGNQILPEQVQPNLFNDSAVVVDR